MLSTVSTIMAMDPTASGMIGQVATGHVMVIEGQTMPDASVRLHVGKTTKLGHSDGSGHFQFKVSEPERDLSGQDQGPEPCRPGLDGLDDRDARVTRSLPGSTR